MSSMFDLEKVTPVSWHRLPSSSCGQYQHLAPELSALCCTHDEHVLKLLHSLASVATDSLNSTSNLMLPLEGSIRIYISRSEYDV